MNKSTHKKPDQKNRCLFKKNRLEIKNIVSVGHFDFKDYLKFDEIMKLIDKGKMEWNLTNVETTPQLTIRKKSKKGNHYCQMWHSGSYYITGTNSFQQARDFSEDILREIKKLIPRVFK